MTLYNSYTSKKAREEGFRSGFEGCVAKYFKDNSVDFEFESDKCVFKYWQKIRNGRCRDCNSLDIVKQRTYTVDFYLPEFDIYIETKGRFTSEDRTKHSLIREQFPEIDLRILFQRDGKATKCKSYSEWCQWKDINYNFVKKTRGGILLPIELQKELNICQ